jgi:hypothetical protein
MALAFSASILVSIGFAPLTTCSYYRPNRCNGKIDPYSVTDGDTIKAWITRNTNLNTTTMWKVTIQCSADSWRDHAAAFKAIAARYATTALSSKKMKGDERRIMEYELENVNDAEEFIESCMTLSGFTGTFEAL